MEAQHQRLLRLPAKASSRQAPPLELLMRASPRRAKRSPALLANRAQARGITSGIRLAGNGLQFKSTTSPSRIAEVPNSTSRPPTKATRTSTPHNTQLHLKLDIIPTFHINRRKTHIITLKSNSTKRALACRTAPPGLARKRRCCRHLSRN